MYSLPPEDLENIFNRVQSFWPQQKVFLITGGTGFFGRWLVESAAYIESKKTSENKFLIYSRQSKSDLAQKMPILNRDCFEIVQQDLKDSFQIESKVDYVLHAASDVSKIKANNVADFSSVLTSTKNVISAVRDKNFIKLLYVSSGGVYAASDDVVENSLKLVPTENINTYAEAKRQSEIEIHNLKQACSARCFSFVGPYVDPKMAVMDMLTKKVKQEKIILNSPEVVRSFMYPTDLIVALFQLLLLETKQREYNIGSDQPVSLLQLAQKISQLQPVSFLKVKTAENSKSLAGQIYYPNIDQIQKEFPNHVTTNLDTALLKTYQFLLKQEKMI